LSLKEKRKQRKLKKQSKFEDSINEKRILLGELNFEGINEANLGNKMKIIFFQTFSCPWMQFSSVLNIFMRMKMF